jgi:homocysteine S-methyltransferase
MERDEVYAVLGGEHGPVLGEGSVYELLRRRPGIEADPFIGTSALIYDAVGREALTGVHGGYLDTAADAGLVCLSLTDTWRASARRIAESAWAGRDVNGDNARFLRALTTERPGARVVIGGLIGPDGDAYLPAEAPDRATARRLHAPQADALAAAGVDLLASQTLPALDEALGMSEAMIATGLPYLMSFVVRADGTILDGTPLGAVLDALDAMPVPPVTVMANCVHPSILDAAMAAEPATAGRLTALQANAAALTPEELDNSEHLISAEPEPFAAAYAEVARRRGLIAVGGCCGTDVRHLRALAAAITAG